MSNPRNYMIVVERVDDGGCGPWAPDLPGCVAPREKGDPIREPSTVAAAMIEAA